MPVDFRCPHCQRGIRAPDQAVGQTMRCPGCNAGVMVPFPGMQMGGGGGNPYAPQAPAPGDPVPKMPLRQKEVQFAEVFGTSMKLLGRQGGLIAGMLLVTMLIELVIMGVLAGLGAIVVWIVSSRFNIVTTDIRITIVVAVALIPFCMAVVVASLSYMIMGLIRAVVNACRGSGNFADLFLAGKSFLWGGLYIFLYTLTLYAVIGLILGGAFAVALLIGSMLKGMDYDPPTIVMYVSVIARGAQLLISVVTTLATLYFLLTLFFIADRDMNVNDGMINSVRFMNGNKLQTFFVLLAVNVLTTIAFVAVALIGGVGAIGAALVLLLVSYSFSMITVTVVYLKATGQATCVDEIPAGPAPGAMHY